MTGDTTPPTDLNVLEFPCYIEVKIFFLNNADDERTVKRLVSDKVGEQWFEKWHCKDSNAGKYRAASAGVKAQNREQMNQLYVALSAHPKVLMVI